MKTFKRIGLGAHQMTSYIIDSILASNKDALYLFTAKLLETTDLQSSDFAVIHQIVADVLQPLVVEHPLMLDFLHLLDKIIQPIAAPFRVLFWANPHLDFSSIAPRLDFDSNELHFETLNMTDHALAATIFKNLHRYYPLDDYSMISEVLETDVASGDTRVNHSIYEYLEYSNKGRPWWIKEIADPTDDQLFGPLNDTEDKVYIPYTPTQLTDEELSRLEPLGDPLDKPKPLPICLDLELMCQDGCRMLTCDEFCEERQDWFTGYCDICDTMIEKKQYALRLPHVGGGWSGCFCGFDCLYGSLDPNDHKSAELIAAMQAALSDHGICDV